MASRPSSLIQALPKRAVIMARKKKITALAKRLSSCQLCDLGAYRTNSVPGEGSVTAEIVFVGEAPGEKEDLEGLPFIGRSGQLLIKMIEAMGLTREEVFICNLVKCRPPENRNPTSTEIETCEPNLFRQLDLIQPKVVVALGKFASQALLKTETPISELRGNFFPYRNSIQLMPTFHPAYLLRNPSAKKAAWEDLQKVMTLLKLKPKAKLT